MATVINDVELIPLQQDDLEQIRKWRNSKEVSEYMYTNKEVSVVEQKQWFERIQKDTTQKYWTINFEGEKLGVVWLYDMNVNFKTAYWGFYLGNSSIRGQGIGRKVEFNILNKFFYELNYNKLLGEVLVFNEKVIKMHEKFGFRREGYFRQHVIRDNIYHDVVSIAILREEWDAMKDTLYKKLYK